MTRRVGAGHARDIFIKELSANKVQDMQIDDFVLLKWITENAKQYFNKMYAGNHVFLENAKAGE